MKDFVSVLTSSFTLRIKRISPDFVLIWSGQQFLSCILPDVKQTNRLIFLQISAENEAMQLRYKEWHHDRTLLFILDPQLKSTWAVNFTDTSLLETTCSSAPHQQTQQSSLPLKEIREGGVREPLTRPHTKMSPRLRSKGVSRGGGPASLGKGDPTVNRSKSALQLMAEAPHSSRREKTVSDFRTTSGPIRGPTTVKKISFTSKFNF